MIIPRDGLQIWGATQILCGGRVGGKFSLSYHLVQQPDGGKISLLDA